MMMSDRGRNRMRRRPRRSPSAAPTCTSSKGTCRDEARDHPRPRGGRHGHRDRGRGALGGCGRSGAALVHFRLRPLPLLPRRSVRPVPGRGRLDLRPPDRRGPGRVRPGAVRGHLDLQGSEGLSDEQVLYLADILATGYEVGVLNGRVQPGDTVAVVGAGPIGPATIVGARLFSPAAIVAVDPAESRRDWASAFGATAVATPEEARGVVAGLTDGLGADVAVEAVGIPETFEQCTELIWPGGRVANVGVHGKAATLHLESLWIRDVTIATGLVDTFSTPTLLRAVATGQLAPTRFTTHRFPLGGEPRRG